MNELEKKASSGGRGTNWYAEALHILCGKHVFDSASIKTDEARRKICMDYAMRHPKHFVEAFNKIERSNKGVS